MTDLKIKKKGWTSPLKIRLKLITLLIMSSFLFTSCSEDAIEKEIEIQDLEEGMNSNIQSKFESGTDNGFYWQLWTEDSYSGNIDYSNGSDGNYSVNWDSNGNFTCGKGWGTGTTTRVVGYNCGSYSHNGGGGSFAVYGWTRNPLIEYYVQEKWPGSRPTSGTNMGTITSDGASYTLRREQRVNAPSIDGTQTFWQLKSTRASQAPTGQNNTVTFANHANGWANGGMSLGSDHSYQILLTEAWGTSNGSVNATVWDQGTSSGSNGVLYPSGVELPITIRARGVSGNEQIRLFVGGNDVGTWTLSTSMNNYSISLWSSRGDVRVEYLNDSSGMDVQIDYIDLGSVRRQAENQSYNTAVWQNGSCGGSNSEWMHCSGEIGFGNTP